MAIRIAPVSSTARIALMMLALWSAAASSVAADAPPRERQLIDDGWRFTLGDPQPAPTDLAYDIRPTVTDAKDDRVADARPEDADKAGPASRPVLKAWILPSGDAFLQNPARRHTRPAGNPGGDVSYVRPDFDDSNWQAVTLPHDWAIAGPFNTGNAKGSVGGGMGRLPTPGVGWYRRAIDVPAADAGRRICLDVEGAMAYASVWCNGTLVGGWPYGYTSWQVDLTPYVVPGGRNVLAIRLENLPDSSRWYTGAGLYRDMWLTKTSPLHVAHWGTRVTTPQVSDTSATVRLDLNVQNESSADAVVGVAGDVFVADANGYARGNAVATIPPANTRIAAGATAAVHATTALPNPQRWGPPPQTPNRYVLVATLRQGDRVVDRYETPFGVRHITFDPNAGLFVNGQHVRIQGVNNHHDLGALGTAFNIRAAERQLQILRDMGCNALRMSHNPPAPELLDLADRMGFLVFDEAFDAWLSKKPPLDFHLIFPDWHEQDLRAMIRRDANHPSVILWSVGNEVGEQYAGKDGARVAADLVAIAHDEDPTRPVTSAMNYAKPDMPFPVAFDVISLNYEGEGIRDTPEFAGTTRTHTPPVYDAFHAKFPDKMILSSETASTLSTRGTYLFPVAPGNSSSIKEGQGGDAKHGFVSAYELYAVDFGSSPDKVFAAQDRHPFVAGEFVWTGFDYLGEPTPYYSARSSYSGIVDLAGFTKDRYYQYQARWRPDLPMAHILPHWTWPERVGQVTPVHVFTSGDEAELFLNSKSLGRKRRRTYEYRLRWDDVVYAPGELKVVAYKDGKQWATDTVSTAETPVKLVATPDRPTIAADGRDLCFVTVRVADTQGRTVPRADDRVTFTVDGPGEIVATDNGDPTCFVPFPSPQRPAFNGHCLAIVRAKKGRAGTIRLTAHADGLREATLVITTKAD